MKVFWITLDFDLKKKPLWLDSFRKLYDEPYDYHITLKYTTLIENKETAKLKRETQVIADESNPLVVEFNDYFFNKTSTGNLIMIAARHNENLFVLQEKVVTRLKKFGETIKPYYQGFEDNFQPHITIARKLSDKKMLAAKDQLREPILCQTKITQLSLKIMDQTDLNAPNKLNETLHYKFRASK